MAIVMTVAPYGATPTRPSVLITVTGLTAGNVIDITRQAPSEDAKRVRGAVSHVMTSATLVLVDTVPSLGRLLTYALSVNGVYTTSATTTVTYTGHHLLTDVATGEGVEVQILNTEDQRTQSARVTVLQPVGAAFPVALYDTRAGISGTLSVLAPDRSTSQALERLLATGRPIASRHRFDFCDIESIEYVYPLDVSNSRFNRAGARTFSLPYMEIDLPDPRLETVLVTLQDIDDWYSPLSGTLLTISTDFATLLDIASDDFGVL